MLPHFQAGKTVGSAKGAKTQKDLIADTDEGEGAELDDNDDSLFNGSSISKGSIAKANTP